jgi:hypothetical protein
LNRAAFYSHYGDIAIVTKYDQKIAQQLQLRPPQVAATLELLDAGNTLPFIARYRKEITGALDEDQIRRILPRRLCCTSRQRRKPSLSIENRTDDARSRKQIEAAKSTVLDLNPTLNAPRGIAQWACRDWLTVSAGPRQCVERSRSPIKDDVPTRKAQPGA